VQPQLQQLWLLLPQQLPAAARTAMRQLQRMWLLLLQHLLQWMLGCLTGLLLLAVVTWGLPMMETSLKGGLQGGCGFAVFAVRVQLFKAMVTQLEVRFHQTLSEVLLYV
jgi:hypothetical protein